MTYSPALQYQPSPISRPSMTNASTDEAVIKHWLHGKAEATVEAYLRDAKEFFRYVRKPIRELKLEDLHRFDDWLLSRSTSTRARKLSSIKSLLSFSHKIGCSQFNVSGAAVNPTFNMTLTGENIATVVKGAALGAVRAELEN